MNNISNAISITERTIQNLLQSNDIIIVSIDGMSGSGKTTFANELSKEFSVSLIHMDDFFLRPEQRTEERINTPGGNADIERLITDVILPIKRNETFVYRPFDCHTMDFQKEKIVTPNKVVIIEGSYSCHPELFRFSDLHIFLYTSRVNQITRILRRNGYNGAKVFLNKWIPLEDKYFSHYCIREKCELEFYI